MIKCRKLVIDALVDAEVPNCNSLGRVYKLRPIKVVQFGFYQPRCVVYFDLNKEECANLSESTFVDSDFFGLGGRWFYLSEFSEKEETFGLFLYMTDNSESCTLDCEFAVMKKSSKEFQDKLKFQHKYPEPTYNGYGYRDMFGIPWMEFVNEDSEYFVEGILHFRADLTIQNAQP